MKIRSESGNLLKIRGPFSGAAQCILEIRMDRDQNSEILMGILMEFGGSSRIGLLSNKKGGVRGVEFR